MIKLQASSVRMLLQIEGKTNIAVFVDTYTDAEILENFNELLYLIPCSSQKIKFSIKDFFSKCDEIQRKLRIWSHLLKRSLMENFIFCAVLKMLI